MARANEEAAELLRELADLLSITGGDAFKIRAYEKAARAVAGHPDDISGLDLAGLRAIPAVGDAIARKILDYTRTGTIRQVEELRARIPAGVRALTAIPTLGRRRPSSCTRSWACRRWTSSRPRSARGGCAG